MSDTPHPETDDELPDAATNGEASGEEVSPRTITEEEFDELDQVIQREQRAEQMVQKFQQELQEARGARKHVVGRLRQKYDLDEEEAINDEGEIVPFEQAQATP